MSLLMSKTKTKTKMEMKKKKMTTMMEMGIININMWLRKIMKSLKNKKANIVKVATSESTY